MKSWTPALAESRVALAETLQDPVFGDHRCGHGGGAITSSAPTLQSRQGLTTTISSVTTDGKLGILPRAQAGAVGNGTEVVAAQGLGVDEKVHTCSTHGGIEKCGSEAGTGVGQFRDRHKQKPVDPMVRKSVDAVKVGDVTCVEQMLARDASLSRATMDVTMAYSPLHWASAKNHSEVCVLLLNAKANVNCCNRTGVTPLHSAALNGSHAVVLKLLAHGANANATDANGRTAEACARSKENSCVTLFDIHGRVQEFKKSPAAWTKKQMTDLLKLLNLSPPSTCSRHELETRVRSSVPALAHVFQDVLLHRKKFLAKSVSMWRANIKRGQWLARTSAHIKALGLFRLLSRSFRHWRVLEREYGAWQRGFAASLAFQEANAHRQMCRNCMTHALVKWCQVLHSRKQLLTLQKKVSHLSDLHRLREAAGCLAKYVKAGRIKTFQNQMAAGHSHSCRLQRFWTCWKGSWQQSRPVYDAWVPLELRVVTGIGAVVCVMEGSTNFTVESLVESGAAARSGKVQVGDVIVAIDDKPIAGFQFDQVRSMIEGPEGTAVVIHGYRGQDKGGAQYLAQLYRGERRYLEKIVGAEVGHRCEESTSSSGSAIKTSTAVADTQTTSEGSMERALKALITGQQRYFGLEAAFEAWALRWHDTRRLMEIGKTCHMSTLRHAVKLLHEKTILTAEARRSRLASRVKTECFRKYHMRIRTLRLMLRWRVQASKSRMGDDLIQRCMRPRTLFEDSELLGLALKAWVTYFWKQVSVQGVLQVVNRRLDRLRRSEYFILWRNVLSAVRWLSLRASRLTMSCSYRLHRHAYHRLRTGLFKWHALTCLRRRNAAKCSGMDARRRAQMGRHAFRCWEVVFVLCDVLS